MNNAEKRIRVVTCPVCGRVLEKARISSKESSCKCGSEVTTLATKGFVATIIHEPGEDELSFNERIRGFQKQLSMFTELVYISTNFIH